MMGKSIVVCTYIITYVIFLMLFNYTNEEELELLSKSRTTDLRVYSQYSNVVIIHMVVPPDALFVSFNFVGSEVDFSVFGCTQRDADLYLKYGSLPVINPDGVKFPKDFKNVTRSNLHHLKFVTDEKDNYINITAPEPGSYYAVTFLSYRDKNDAQIKQEGLGERCSAFVDATVYVKTLSSSRIIVQNNEFKLSTPSNVTVTYKTFVPENTDYAVLLLKDVTFSNSAEKLTFSVQVRGLPSSIDNIKTVTITPTNVTTNIRFITEETNWHYLQFYFSGSGGINNNNSLTFSLKFFSTRAPVVVANASLSKNNFKNAVTRYLPKADLTEAIPYKQYDLVRGSISESFAFSYQLEEELDNSTPLPINLTSTDFTTLKFSVQESTDIGGTLQFILAFKPRIVKEGKTFRKEEEPENNTIVACIRKDVKEVPTWPDKCVYNKIAKKSLLVLNKTVSNDSLMIAFPESGDWYVTFRLFCGDCIPCDCPENCQQNYDDCLRDCEQTCTFDNCNECSSNCKREIIAQNGCQNCNCTGDCKSSNATTCDSSVVFDVSSNCCINGYCGKNGNCILMVSDSVVYSTCRCTNRYRGWDCADDSHANPMWEVFLELFLLVLSNLAFLPAVYIAYKRKYYLESVCYFMICFFSTFYHACDAGENLINFCIARLNALQFADFFCALLAIWVTLIAIADFQNVWTNILQITGAILLAFFTTINMHALWTFAVPSGVGVALVCVSWYLKYRKIKQMFVNKRYVCLYVPVGTIVVTVGLIIYALLQTEKNYKYLHSMWHVMMAIAVIILLPRPDTFQPRTVL